MKEIKKALQLNVGRFRMNKGVKIKQTEFVVIRGLNCVKPLLFFW